MLECWRKMEKNAAKICHKIFKRRKSVYQKKYQVSLKLRFFLICLTSSRTRFS